MDVMVAMTVMDVMVAMAVMDVMVAMAVMVADVNAVDAFDNKKWGNKMDNSHFDLVDYLEGYLVDYLVDYLEGYLGD